MGTSFSFEKDSKGILGLDGVEAVLPLKRNEDGSFGFINKEEVMTNDRDQLVKEVADICARHFSLVGHHFSRPFWPSDIADYGDSTKAGLLMAAAELRGVLGKFDEGRKALRDLGFEPVFQNLECK